jgi:hypothetical protein
MNLAEQLDDDVMTRHHLPNGPAPAPAHRPIVPTEGFLAAQTKITAVVQSRTICTIDGELGTGKSTVVGYYAAESGFVCRLVEIPPSASSKQAFVHIYIQLTGHTPIGSADSIRSDLIEVLATEDYVMLLDEAQNLGVIGLRLVRNLWDECRRLGRPFPLVIGGCGIVAALARVPELLDRVAVHHEMKRLSTDELLTVVHALHPRLARADDGLLMNIDQRYARGNLRKWDQFLTILDAIDGSPAQGSNGPLTKKLAGEALTAMGRPEVKL